MLRTDFGGLSEPLFCLEQYKQITLNLKNVYVYTLYTNKMYTLYMQLCKYRYCQQIGTSIIIYNE